jgi:adenylate cyclase class 2
MLGARLLMNTTFETEVKLASDDLDRFRKAGFELRLEKPRYFEDNWLLDTKEQKLLEEGAALRVRSIDGKGLITYKGVVRGGSSPLKVREEIEVEIADPDRVIELFERLGFQRVFRYQKYRTVYCLILDGQQLKVTFDETPMGNFIEIEGDEQKVLRVMATVGFTPDDVIRESYPEMQAARCRQRGVPLEDLVF